MNFRITMVLYFYFLLHGVSAQPFPIPGSCSDMPCHKDALDDKINHETTDCYNHLSPFCAGEINYKHCCSIGNYSIGAVCDSDARCYVCDSARCAVSDARCNASRCGSDDAFFDSRFEYCSSVKRICVMNVGGPCRNEYDCEDKMNCTGPDETRPNDGKVCKMPFNKKCTISDDCPTFPVPRMKCKERKTREPVDGKTCLMPNNTRCEKSENCEDGLVCLKANQLCLPPIGLGGECLGPDDGDCETDLVCQYNEAEKGKLTCNAKTDKFCGTHKDCVLDSTCKAEPPQEKKDCVAENKNCKCVLRLNTGEKGCVDDEDCKPGLICEGGASKTCVIGLGGTCAKNDDCSRDLICSESSLKCISDLGGVCYQNTDCFGDLTCENLREGVDRSQKTCVAGLGKKCYRNAHCSTDSMYKEALICERTLDDDGRCVSVLGGFCQTTATCSSGLECQGVDDASKICVARLGGECYKNEVCLTDLICQEDKTLNEKNQTCVARLGGFCENTAHCENGLTCEGNNSDTCVAGLGGFCYTEADCLNILTCEGDNLQTCVSGRGGVCSTDADCFGNLTCEGNATLNETQTCVAALGEACSADAHCSEDLVCEGDRCVSGLGGVCFTDADCSGELICSGVCAEVVPSRTLKIIVPTILILIGLAVLS